MIRYRLLKFVAFLFLKFAYVYIFIFRVQRGYALQLQGKLDAATKLYAHVLKAK